jgi:ribosomal protein S18 acetylase RimI-like enzyme
MGEYRLCTHADVGDRGALHRAVANLNRLTFGHYDGVVVPSEFFVEWYAARPGMDPRLCQAAFAGDELVSSVLVTLARMRLAGNTVVCGIIDEVMTHPDHRRRGLANALMQRALESMQAAGAGVSLLNTLEANPPAGPQRLYESLGYRVYERVDRFAEAAGRRNAAAQAIAMPPDDAACAAFLEGLGERDGWLDLDDDLWRWRRIERPIGYPVGLFRTGDGGLGAVSTGDLVAAGGPTASAVLSDVVLPADPRGASALAQLVAAAPSDAPVTVLCPRSDPRLGRLLMEEGFEVTGTELAMLRPFTAEVATTIEQQTDCWYVAVESVIGV